MTGSSGPRILEALGILAVLRALWSVYAVESDTLASDVDRVAIDHGSASFDGRSGGARQKRGQAFAETAIVRPTLDSLLNGEDADDRHQAVTSRRIAYGSLRCPLRGPVPGVVNVPAHDSMGCAKIGRVNRLCGG